MTQCALSLRSLQSIMIEERKEKQIVEDLVIGRPTRGLALNTRNPRTYVIEQQQPRASLVQRTTIAIKRNKTRGARKHCEYWGNKKYPR